jgi:hypothetical protein
MSYVHTQAPSVRGWSGYCQRSHIYDSLETISFVTFLFLFIYTDELKKSKETDMQARL